MKWRSAFVEKPAELRGLNKTLDLCRGYARCTPRTALPQVRSVFVRIVKRPARLATVRVVCDIYRASFRYVDGSPCCNSASDFTLTIPRASQALSKSECAPPATARIFHKEIAEHLRVYRESATDALGE